MRTLPCLLVVAAFGALATGACSHAWDGLDILGSASSSGASSSSSTSTSSGLGGGGFGGMGGLGGAVSSGGSPPGGPCGTSDLLWWDVAYDATVSGPQSGLFQLIGPPTVNVQNPKVLNLAAGSVGGVSSLRFYNLTSAVVRIDGLDADPNNDGALEIRYFDGDGFPPSHVLGLCKQGSKIYCGSPASPPNCSGTPIDFNKGDVYLRLTADAQYITCSTWDGISLAGGDPAYTEMGKIPISGAVLPPTRVQLAAVASAAVGSIKIQDLGYAPKSLAPGFGAAWCAPVDLVDKLTTGPVPGPLWNGTNLKQKPIKTAAGLSTTFDGKTDEATELFSETAYDMTASSVTLRTSDLPADCAVSLSLENRLMVGSGRRVQLLVDPGTTKNAYLYCDGQSPIPPPDLNLALSPFLRVGHVDGDPADTVSMLASQDGMIWTPLGACTMADLDLRKADVHLKASCKMNATGTIVLSDVNHLP
jgi:hypothetical protein